MGSTTVCWSETAGRRSSRRSYPVCAISNESHVIETTKRANKQTSPRSYPGSCSQREPKPAVDGVAGESDSAADTAYLQAARLTWPGPSPALTRNVPGRTLLAV